MASSIDRFRFPDYKTYVKDRFRIPDYKTYEKDSDYKNELYRLFLFDSHVIKNLGNTSINSLSLFIKYINTEINTDAFKSEISKIVQGIDFNKIFDLFKNIVDASYINSNYNISDKSFKLATYYFFEHQIAFLIIKTVDDKYDKYKQKYEKYKLKYINLKKQITNI